ncbi:MAG: hypothetical protein LBV58_02690 [Acholeplasmatales bacterium]|jgi:predicted O-methyltransferase YrrM|nr:hypothetical protein [Acholeplasmatales bacterium]
MELDILRKKLELEKYPIILKDTEEFFRNFILDNKIKSILEIGCNVGFSSIFFKTLNVSVTTFEKDILIYELAKLNYNDFGFDTREIILHDCTVPYELDKKYDLLFIDAAKASYLKFFINFEKNLKVNGYLVCDNMNLHGIRVDDLKRNKRRMAKRLASFRDFMEGNKNYEVSFLEIGDGLLLAKRLNI